MSAAAVRDGAPDLPYDLVQDDVVAKTGNSTYAGCTAYRETAVSDVWTRPDGTSYVEALGPGTPETVADICVSTVIDSRNMATGSGASNASCSGDEWMTCTWSTWTWYATINKTQKKNPENGQVVSATCGFSDGKWQGWSVSTPHSQTTFGFLGSPSSAYNSQTLFIPPCPF